MAETIGKITNVKVASFLPGSVNSFDVGAITLKETSTGTSWLFYVWNSRDDDGRCSVYSIASGWPWCERRRFAV